VYICFCFCEAYPLPDTHCLVLVNECADEEEKDFVKEYIKDHNIYIKLGISFILSFISVSLHNLSQPASELHSVRCSTLLLLSISKNSLRSCHIMCNN